MNEHMMDGWQQQLVRNHYMRLDSQKKRDLFRLNFMREIPARYIKEYQQFFDQLDRELKHG